MCTQVGNRGSGHLAAVPHCCWCSVSDSLAGAGASPAGACCHDPWQLASSGRLAVRLQMGIFRMTLHSRLLRCVWLAGARQWVTGAGPLPPAKPAFQPSLADVFGARRLRHTVTTSAGALM